MEYILIAVIVLQWAYIIYKEESIRKEREKLQLKLMSRDVTEYKEAVEPEPKPVKKEEDPYVDITEVPINKLLRAEDNL